MSAQAPAPGWYADPQGGPSSRWWDGRQWTEHLLPVAPPAAHRPAAQQNATEQNPSMGKAASGPPIFEATTMVVSQKAKLIELTNEYDVKDAQGVPLGRVVEVGQSQLKKAVRFLGNYDQFFTHRLEVRDTNGTVLLVLTRPAKFMKSRMQITHPDDTPIGEIVQENVFGKKRFSFSAGGVPIGGIRGENWRMWDFKIEDASGAEVGRINKQWAGIGRELFTTADHYQVQLRAQLPFPLRYLAIAAALTVDTALKQDD